MSDSAHQLVCALKTLSIELGRVPTRNEFVQTVRNGKDLVDKLFGGYTLMLMAAGIEPPRKAKEKKIDNSVFNVDISKHLENYEPEPEREVGPFPTMAIISDVHWPFVNKRVVEKFCLYVLDNQPEWVIINGDAWDMYSHSKFPRSHNVFTPKEEQELARKGNEDFWSEIKKISPKSKCIQMMGNHDIRPMKRILEAYPEAADWIEEKLTKLFAFDGVQTIMDPRQELYVTKEILVFHGYMSQLGAHRDGTLCSTFNGHSHVGGCVFRKIRGSVLFECNSGLAGDPHSKGLTYTPQKITKWTPGFTGCDKWGPRFIPA